jgi:hypothetical protein
MKKCSTCKKFQLLSNFYNDVRTKDRLSSVCKDCHRLAYFCVIVGMLGMASTHSDPRFAWAIFLLALANALFLYR